MIIDEIKVNTKRELDNLFHKLVKEEFFWANEEYLLGRGLDIVTGFPAYIHLHDNKKVTWHGEPLRKEFWNCF